MEYAGRGCRMKASARDRNEIERIRRICTTDTTGGGPGSDPLAKDLYDLDRGERIFSRLHDEGTNFQTRSAVVTFERSRYNHSRYLRPVKNSSSISRITNREGDAIR